MVARALNSTRQEAIPDSPNGFPKRTSDTWAADLRARAACGSANQYLLIVALDRDQADAVLWQTTCAGVLEMITDCASKSS